MENFSYAELYSLWKRGLRNGAFRRMSVLERGLFSASLGYSKMTGAIVNKKLVEMLGALAERIVIGLGHKIFRHGLERGKAFSCNGKIMRVFRGAEEWITDDTYTFWLGTEMLGNKRKWILFQSL